MKKEILKWLIHWFAFFLSVWLCFVAYAAWTNILTRTDGTTINATIWNELVNNINTIGAKVDTLSNVPSWFIWAFYLSTCPTWWIAADGNNSTPNLRWEFIRGWDYNNSGVDNGRTLWSSQAGTVTYSYGNANGGVPFAPFENMDASSIVTVWTSYNVSPWSLSGWGTTKWVTRPRNIALLYCMKQ